MGSATMRQVTLEFVMVEVKLSKRAQEVLTRFALRSTLSAERRGPLPYGGQDIICIPQKELAKELGCSRWSIGRAIKCLKEAGLLQETGRDKQSRCKTYALQAPFPPGGEELRVRFTVEKGSGDEGWIAASATPPRNDEIPLCQRGEIQLQNYRRTFELNFIHWPDWEKHYAAVTWALQDVHCIHKLFRQTFDRLYEIRFQETGITDPNLPIQSP